jgi:hypothetical protein
MATVSTNPQEKVRACVVAALEEKRDIDSAIEYALRSIRKQGLDDEMTDHIVRDFATSEVQRRAHDIRQGHKAVVTSKRTIDNAVAYGVAVGILESWMVMGVRMADAKRDDLLAAAESERNSARGHLVNAAFYESVAKKLGNGKTVSEVLTAEQVSAMLRNAEGGVK